MNLINSAVPSTYVPAAFFMQFRPDHLEGQPAIDRHLEFFRATGMDFLKIQYEQVLPPAISISNPEDWADVPPCTDDFFEPTLHIVRELVRAVKSEAPVIMTLYSPFMWFKFLAEAGVVNAHFRENPDAMKKVLAIFTDYILTLVRLCKQAGVDGFYASTQGGEASGCFNEWFDVLFIAITFAEAGGIDTARDPSGGGTGDGEHPVAYCLSGFSAGRA